jgi:hypothetical protein
MNKNQTLEFLDGFFGHYSSGHEWFIELRFIRDGRPPKQKFLNLSELSEADLQEIENLNAEYNVYFGVCPRPNDKATKDADIKEGFCLWVDVDGKDYNAEDWERGKTEARKAISNFHPDPSIIVDSGHGWQCYWLMRTPLDISTDEKQLVLRQVLSGLVKAINGDAQRLNPSSMMRLPGTINIKHLDEPDRYSGPTDCKTDTFHPNTIWTIEDFARYIDLTYQRLPALEDVELTFGKKKLLVCQDNAEVAVDDVKKLGIGSLVKRRIITGENRTEQDVDHTRSGRDWWIELRLILFDYDYETLHSIFFNPHLGCSDRIRKKGESFFIREVRKAWLWVEAHKKTGTPQWQHILEIKKTKNLIAEERRVLINSYTIMELLTGENAAGYGLKNADRKAFYFFDKQKRMLMDLEQTDFYCYMRYRFCIGKRDFEEMKDAVMTEIQQTGQEVEPHQLSYFDSRTQTLYVSDHDNGIFKMDGETVQHVYNGTDGVFFEYNPEYSSYKIDPTELNSTINYFEIEEQVPEHQIEGLGTVREHTVRRLGFNPIRFYDSLLNQFLVEIGNFSDQTESGFRPEEQRILLTVYFYSLFFADIMKEKPIACFIGLKESGKSTLATLIGKILFGPRFESRHLPENIDHLKTVLGANKYLVFDNLDQSMDAEAMNTLCVAATGGTVEKRKLYTDHDIARFVPNVFLAITTREGHFRRDDLVSRLLMFATKKVDSPIAKSKLYGDIEEHRNSLMAEILINLNSVVKLLRASRGEMNMRCVSRVADWEMFGRRICRSFPWRFYFVELMEMMNTEKSRFSLEDDYLYIVLKEIVLEGSEPIIDVPAAELYSLLRDQAELMELKDWEKRYKSPVSLGNRLAHIKEELNEAMEFTVRVGSGNKRYYTFRPLSSAEG